MGEIVNPNDNVSGNDKIKCPHCSRRHYMIWIEGIPYCRKTKKKFLQYAEEFQPTEIDNSLKFPYKNATGYDTQMYSAFVKNYNIFCPKMEFNELITRAKFDLMEIDTSNYFKCRDSAIARFCHLLDLASKKLLVPERLKEQIIKLFKKTLGVKELKRKNIYVACAALIYIVCSNNRFPLDLRRIVKAFYNVRGKSVNNYVLCFKQLYNVEIRAIEPEDMIKKACSDFEFDSEMTNEALRQFKSLQESDFSFQGKSMKPITGALIYNIAKKNGIKLTLDEIGEGIGTSDNTISKRYHEIKELIET